MDNEQKETQETMVLITKREYESLLWDMLRLNFLEARGVNNWEGYGTPPKREDFDTEEEWKKAYDRALNPRWW